MGQAPARSYSGQRGKVPDSDLREWLLVSFPSRPQRVVNKAWAAWLEKGKRTVFLVRICGVQEMVGRRRMKALNKRKPGFVPRGRNEKRFLHVRWRAEASDNGVSAASLVSTVGLSGLPTCRRVCCIGQDVILACEPRDVKGWRVVSLPGSRIPVGGPMRQGSEHCNHVGIEMAKDDAIAAASWIDSWGGHRAAERTKRTR